LNTSSKIFGYVRISTKEQNIDRQYNEMITEGIEDRDIFIDKVSGSTFNREQYQLLKHMLRPGDTVVIKSLDRLGRNYKEMIKELNSLRDNSVSLKILDMPMLNEYNNDSTISRLLYDLTVQILSFVAENEVQQRKKSQLEGIAVAKKKGVHFGRPKANIESFDKYYELWQGKKITATKAAAEMGISRTTFYKLINKIKNVSKLDTTP